MPDSKVEPQYVSAFAATLYLIGLIDDFGDDYYRRHPEQVIDPATFTITDSDYEDFCRMVEGADVPYKSDSRQAVEKLRKALDKERYADSELLSAMQTIEQGLKDDKMSNLQTFRNEIIRTINSDIVLRYNYAEGRTANSLSYDNCIKAALDMLDNEAEMSRILSSQDTARK